MLVAFTTYENFLVKNTDSYGGICVKLRFEKNVNVTNIISFYNCSVYFRKCFRSCFTNMHIENTLKSNMHIKNKVCFSVLNNLS